MTDSVSFERSRSRRRRFLRQLVRMLQPLVSRVEVRGVERIPERGPLLLLFSHLSTLDGVLVVANVPHEIELVGPGDFPATALENRVMDSYGLIRVNRGRPDRASLRRMVDILRAGKMLAIAPGGGTWEKGPLEAKPGPFYLSQVTGAPMMPVAIGGMYEAPTPGLRVFLRRPRVTIAFGDVIPPVPRGADTAEREAQIQEASDRVMGQLFALLPEEDQCLYQRWARARYDLRVTFATLEDDSPLAYDGPPLPDLSAVGEFAGKPNLFRPVHVNARLNVEPFLQARFFAPLEVQIAARELADLLTHPPYEVYLPYRLGEEKARLALEGLRALHDTACPWAIAHHARIRLEPLMKDT